ncbi:MAG: ATP synthase F1 subunit gamma [Oscillospiraceae bacterium]|nr:ATP synthase F1 subunit gamma [Oscillospiraceae bacterium]
MAGVSTKDIKNRIRSRESTKQITKAMEMVAASKLRQAQNRITASRPYFEILSHTISDIVANNRDFTSPYLRKREGNRVLFVVIAGDRGLAGGYNSNVMKLAVANMEGKDATVLPIGKNAVDYFRSKGYPLLAESYAEAADVNVGDCFSIAKLLSKSYLGNQFDEIHVAYTNFVSVLSQTPAVRQLLPLIPEEREQTEGRRCVTLYEPDPEEVFASIVPEYLGGIVYGALCESRCAEQAARRTAMDSATSNAEDMIADLSLKYNRARQAAITQEITEIVAGAEA